MKLLIKTPRGLENIVASKIQDTLLGTSYSIVARPKGYIGLVLVEAEKCEPSTLLKEIPEIEKLLVIEEEVEASLDEICKASVKVAKKCIGKDESFAVRTTRRGRHEFSSIDVNVKAGACIQEAIGNPVDLTYPDKIIWIEIIDEKAYLSCSKGELEHRKKYPGKPDVRRLMEKIVAVQVPYLGDLKGARAIGIRIGRVAQTFHIKALYIAPYYRVNAIELKEFIDGVVEGIYSRFKIQKKTSAKPENIKTIPVYLQDLYQFVRDHKDEGIIVTSTKGKALKDVREDLRRLFREKKVVNILIGSREGIPTGVFRFADLVIDVAPGMTLATDVALSSVLTAIIWALTL